MARPLKQIDARQVKALAEIGCTIGEIAAVTGAGKRTIETRFRAAIHQGQEWRNVSVRRMAFRAARKGSAPVIIFLLKNCCGMRDTPIEPITAATPLTADDVFARLCTSVSVTVSEAKLALELKQTTIGGKPGDKNVTIQ